MTRLPTLLFLLLSAGPKAAALGCLEVIAAGVPVEMSTVGNVTRRRQVHVLGGVDLLQTDTLATRDGELFSHRIRRVRRESPPDRPNGIAYHRTVSEDLIATADLHYGERRQDWDDEFRRILRELTPSYRNDAILFAVTNAGGRTLGTLRMVHAPYGRRMGVIVPDAEVVRRFGYATDRGFRPAALRWNGERAEFRAVDTDTFPVPPPRLLQGEEILQIEMPRDSDEGVLWKLTSFTVDPNLPAALHARVWTELWSLAVSTIFSGASEFAYRNQTIFTYGTRSSLRLYAPLGIELARRYYRNGRLVVYGPDQTPPPIVINGIPWWPMVFPIARMERYHTLMSLRAIPRFEQVDTMSRLHELSPALEGFGAELLENPGPHIARLGGPEDNDATYRLHRFFQIAAQHEAGTRLASAEVASQSAWAWQQAQPLLDAALEGILNTIRRGPPEARAAAARTLGGRREWATATCARDGDRVLSALLAATSDTVPRVRLAALRALQRYVEIGERLGEIAPRLRDVDDDVRQEAFFLVANLLHLGVPTPPRLLPLLVAAIDDSSSRIAGNTLLAIRSYGPRAASAEDRIAGAFFRWRDLSHVRSFDSTYEPFPAAQDHRRFAAAAAYQAIRAGRTDRLRLMLEVFRAGARRFRLFAGLEIIRDGDPVAVAEVRETIGRMNDAEDWDLRQRLRQALSEAEEGP